jgi:exosortase A-associated hydrolase 1
LRRLLTFPCAGETLAGTLEDAAGDVGILIVTGGTQTRVGSHRMLERLAAGLAAAGHPCFRYDRRGVGDSGGEDPGYEHSREDMLAAAAAFRAEVPHLRRVIGFGLCDGATVIALYGGDAGLGGLLLANPWLVEAASNAPAPAYVRRHYRQRLFSAAAWRRALTGQMGYRKALAGLRRAVTPTDAALAERVNRALEGSGLPTMLILATGDATAIAAEAEWRTVTGRPDPIRIESDSHTFARAGDRETLLAACLQAIGRTTF